MKLNPDCVRDVLLYLEKNLSYSKERDDLLEHTSITMHKIAEDLSYQNGYEIDEVNYSVEKLLEVRFIIPETEVRGHNNGILYCPISDISWNGHQFLNNIRQQTIWDATKVGAKKIGATSITAFSMIAMEIIKAIVTKPEVINTIISGFKL